MAIVPTAAEPVAHPLRVGASLRLHLAALVRRRGWTERLEQQQAFRLWPDVVGPTIAAHSQPVHISRGILVVDVSNSVWATQLTFLKTSILQQLRAAGASLHDMRFRVAMHSLPFEPSTPSNAHAVPHQRPAAPPAASLDEAFTRMREAASSRRARWSQVSVSGPVP